MQKRYENPRAVEIEIDADGWPHVTIFTADGQADSLHCRPNGHAEIIAIEPDPDPIYNK